MGFKNFLFKSINRIFRVQVINPEKEIKSGVLLCSNHISFLDPILLVTSLKTEPKFMAKKELFKIPVVSSVIKMFGAFPVERGSVDLSAMKKAISLLDEGNTVGMFPQGTRYSGVEPQTTDVKRGAGMIVTRSCVDVLPVAIITKNNKCKFFSKKYIVVGDLIEFESLNVTDRSREEFDRISKIIFDRICDLHTEYMYLVK